MSDTMSREQRHNCMSRIRSKNTKPELKVRRWLWSHGYRYRLNVKGVPGKPDIVMRPYRTAIFVNGCFWHGHQNCKKFKMPQSNREFWHNKIARNRERDQQNYQLLYENGWHVIVIWECQLEKQHLERTMQAVSVELNDNLLQQYRKVPHGYSPYTETASPMVAETTSEYTSKEH